MRKSIALAVCALGFWAVAGNLSAQATASATIQGTVSDKSGASLPNAEVKVTGKDTGLTRVTTSGESGDYRFDLLPAGRYEVRITAKGFATAVFENVTAAVAQTTTIDAVMNPSAQAETVTVEAAGAPLLDTLKTDVGLPVNTKMAQDLPLNGRDFVSLAYLAPGAKPVNSYDPTKNRTGVFGINGSNGRNVNITVNGVDNKDNTVGGPVMQLPLEAIQEFNIATQRFSAANGRSEGAAVNVITKSGSNEFHGSLYGFFRDEAFNAQNFFESQKAPFSRQQFGGSVGGPVKKDKDFLFFALERIRERTSINVTPTAFRELSLLTSLGAKPVSTIGTPYDDWRYNGRFDHRFNEKHQLALSYTNQNNKGENDQSAQTNDLTAGNFTTNQLIIANATLSSVLTPNIVNSFTAGYQYWNNLIDSKDKLPYFSFPQGIYFGTNPNVPQQSYQTKWQLRDDISIIRGKHALKFGGDVVFMPKLGGFFGNTVTNYTFFDLPSVILGDRTKYPQGLATPGALQAIQVAQGNPYFNINDNVFMLGLYAQDDWKISKRLTVNFGLRYDLDHNLLGSKQLQQNRPYLALRAINSPYGGAVPKSNLQNFSPRFGFAYDLTGAGKHVIRAGYGIYFGQPFVNIPLFALQAANPTLYATVVDVANSAPPGSTGRSDVVPGTNILLGNYRLGVDPAVVVPPPATTLPNGASGRMVDPNYRNPYTQQWNAGYSWAINPNNVVEVEYVHVLGLHESKRININPTLPSLGGQRPFTAAFRAANQTQFGRILMEMPIGRSRYDGLNLSYRKRMTRHFTVNTNYVFSRSVGYNGFSGAFGNAPTNMLDWFGKQDFGYTASDERHRWVLSGVVELPFGIKFSPIVQLASARPYTAVQGISDVFGFGSGVGATHVILLNDQPNNLRATAAFTTAQLNTCLAENRCSQGTFGNVRGQTFFQFDARFSKVIKFGERRTLDLFFQAFDLTDRANFGQNFVTNIRSAAFGTPNGFLAPSSTIVPRSFSGEFGATFRF
jgi:hypothetical protein